MTSSGCSNHNSCKGGNKEKGHRWPGLTSTGLFAQGTAAHVQCETKSLDPDQTATVGQRLRCRGRVVLGAADNRSIQSLRCEDVFEKLFS